MIGQSIATFSIATYNGGTVFSPSTDGTSGGRGYGRIISGKNRVFEDRPIRITKNGLIEYIEQKKDLIEATREEISHMEIREERMNHLLMMAKGTQQALIQAQRLERLQQRIKEKRLLLDDEEAFMLILEAASDYL